MNDTFFIDGTGLLHHTRHGYVATIRAKGRRVWWRNYRIPEDFLDSILAVDGLEFA